VHVVGFNYREMHCFIMLSEFINHAYFPRNGDSVFFIVFDTKFRLFSTEYSLYILNDNVCGLRGAHLLFNDGIRSLTGLNYSDFVSINFFRLEKSVFMQTW
jgi:hypothetical protein